MAPLPEIFSNIEPKSVLLIDSRGTRDKERYGQYRSDRSLADTPANQIVRQQGTTLTSRMLARVQNRQGCATACTTSMQCCDDGRTSRHVTWFKRLRWQTVQPPDFCNPSIFDNARLFSQPSKSDHKRVVPKAGLRTTLYQSCTICVRLHHVM